MREKYETDLTDEQWAEIEPLPVFTVHSFYRRARLSGLWDRILEHLVKVTREKDGRAENPTYAIVDSQSVKTTSSNDNRGYDEGKNEGEKETDSS